MKKKALLTMLAMAMMAVLCGCSAKLGERTGFLSDYSKLKPYSKVSYRYAGPNLGRYSKLIVDPIKTHFHTGSKGSEIPKKQLKDLKNYFHTAVLREVPDHYTIVYWPGPGVARARIAITDLKKSKVLRKIHPATKLIGSGLGGASMEAEMVDSQTGEQIVAALESQLGKRFSLGNVSSWSDAKAVMDEWAKRLGERLEKAHSRR